MLLEFILGMSCHLEIFCGFSMWLLTFKDAAQFFPWNLERSLVQIQVSLF